MAPRKPAKHSEAEVVERAAEAGVVSPPKKKKAVAKAASKSDEEKQIRFPRAAKSTKIEQTEGTETATAVTRNAKTKPKASVKNASVTEKPNSKIKSVPKRNKEAAEKGDTNPVNEEIVKNVEETETKKTRAKATVKKAGINVNEESKGKSKGKAKREPVNENAENLEAPSAKKRKQANAEPASKESKPKAKATKKRADVHDDTKNKIANKANNKAKITSNNETENNVKTEDDKSRKVTAPRKARGRKNESNSDDITKDDEEVKATEKFPSDSILVTFRTDTNNESETTENNESESAQTAKKGRNVKKKEAPQKKPTKMRGKAAFTEDDIDATKTVKETQKKTNKESVATTKRGRGKNVDNTTAEEKKILNSSETLSSNNMPNSSEDNGKKEDSEKEEAKYTKMLGSPKKLDEIHIKDEMGENNVMSTSVHEEEN